MVLVLVFVLVLVLFPVLVPVAVWPVPVVVASVFVPVEEEPEEVEAPEVAASVALEPVVEVSVVVEAARLSRAPPRLTSPSHCQAELSTPNNNTVYRTLKKKDRMMMVRSRRS